MMGLTPDKRAMCRLGETVETWDAAGQIWKVQPQTFEDFTYLNGGTCFSSMPLCASVFLANH
jgi:hypothetical protein